MKRGSGPSLLISLIAQAPSTLSTKKPRRTPPSASSYVGRSTSAGSSTAPNEIEGFEFQPGVTAVIEVRQTEIEDPPTDASSVRTELVRVISETRGLEPEVERWSIGSDAVTCQGFDGDPDTWRLARRDSGEWDTFSKPISGFEAADSTAYKLDVTVSPGEDPVLVEVISSEVVPPLSVGETARWEVLPRNSKHCWLDADAVAVPTIRTSPGTAPRLTTIAGFDLDFYSAYVVDVKPAPGGGFELVEIIETSTP